MSFADTTRAIEVRPLRRDELPQAPELLAPEGWAFTVPELERLQRLGGAVGAWEDGRLVGFLTYADHPPVRWVGNVVVSPTVRGRGVGARIVEKTFEGHPRVGLYAVEKAVTLYQRLGFTAHGTAVALRAQAAQPRRPTASERVRRDDLLALKRFDQRHTTLDRGILLRELVQAYPDTALLTRHAGGEIAGYGIAKTYSGVTEVGPLVAETAPLAEDLLDALLAATPGPHEATVLEANRRAVGAFEARGFAPAFRTVLMYRGAPLPWRVGALAAAAGPEKG